MFTGIVDHTGKIVSAQKRGDLRIAATCDFKNITPGESIAVNGVCLTVVEKTKDGFVADVSEETLARTALDQWKKGSEVNLERALKLGDALSGHMVTGHVDGVVKILEIKSSGASKRWCLKAPKDLAKFIAKKGSVTLDGVSLTVNNVEGRKFFVNIIPHTAKRTTLSARKAGDVLNLEIDIIARYVERLLER
jgi:riboflavin synthase